MTATAQPPVVDKDMDKETDKDIEKTTPHSPGADDLSDGADSTLAALQRVRTAEEDHPIHWSALKKWNIVFWYCLLQAFVTLTTTTYVAAESLVQAQFGGTTQVVALGQSMFIIGTAIGPVFLGPLSYVVSDPFRVPALGGFPPLCLEPSLWMHMWCRVVCSAV